MRTMRALAAVCTAAVFASLCMAAPAQAKGQRGDTIAASVAPGSQVGEANGRFYLIQAKGGAVVDQKLRVTNTNDHAVDVVVEPVDANTSNDTGVAYSQPGSPKSGM